MPSLEDASISLGTTRFGYVFGLHEEVTVAMWLLNTENLEIVSKPDNDVPPYAILSHTWGPGEVSLQDMQGFGGKLLSTASRMKLFRAKQGLKKVIDAARLASSQGYQWIWIDTCCIDKTSSAELSEAINSMYRWYEASKVCYVYVEDARAPRHQNWDLGREGIRAALQQSRWATRGWTLQELLAPQVVQFYDGDWAFMGKKSDRVLQTALSEVTGIEIGVLSGQTTAAEVSVANRMKWASRRQTTRPEDAAYCLMGLFGVNMPLLYGEGAQRAFIRLQEEILKATDDQSIFAWKLPPGSKDVRVMFGLLANSPAHFDDAPSMRPVSTEFQSVSSVPWTMTNKGLQVQLYLRPEGDRAEEEYVAVLDCFQDDEDVGAHPQGHSPSIRLRRLAGDQYTRIKAKACEWVVRSNGDRGRYESFFVKQNPGFVLPRLAVSDSLRFQQPFNAWRLREVFPGNQWSEETGTLRLDLSRLRGIQAVFRFGLLRYSPQPSDSGETYLNDLDVVIVLHQSAREELEVGCYPSAPGGDGLKRVYSKLSRIWSTGPSTPEKMHWIQTSQKNTESMLAIVDMAKAIRAGRGLYLLNIRERFELDDGTPKLEMHGESLDEESAERVRAAQAIIKTESPEEHMRGSMGRAELEPHLRVLDSRQYIRRHDLRSHLRDKVTDIAQITDPEAFSLCQAVIDENLQAIDDILERTSLADSSQAHQISTLEGLQAIHFAVFAANPEVVSKLIQKGIDPLVKTKEGHTALQLASIFGNSGVIQPLLRTTPPAEAEDEFDPVYPKALSRFRSHFGSEVWTGDTALHLAAMCCSGAEFENIVAELLRATGVADSDWSGAEADQEREYLFKLRNNGGETVLHRAIEAGNLGVVEIICRKTPEVATRLDGLSRSTVWHTANRGDTEMLQAVATAYSQSRYPPDIHVSDDSGLTPLHVACWGGHLSFVRELVKRGATSYWATRALAGLTPADMARKNRRERVSELLEQLSRTNT